MSQDKLKPFLLLLTLLLKIVSRYMYIYRIAWVYRDMYCELHVLSHPYVNAFFSRVSIDCEPYPHHSAGHG